MKDLILTRSEAVKCPICNEDITADFKLVEYKSDKIWICGKHYVAEKGK